MTLLNTKSMYWSITTTFFRISVYAICTTLISTVAAQSDVETANWTDLPLAKGIKRGVLPNGLTYFILANDKDGENVEMRLMLKVGSVQEDEDQLGVADFVMHMGFSESKKYLDKDARELLGTKITEAKSHQNGFVNFDKTSYIVRLNQADSAQTAAGLKALRFWAGDLQFKQSDIDSVRPELLEEARTGISAMKRLGNKGFPIIYEGSRYGVRIPSGDSTILKHAGMVELMRYYKNWYRPNLMAIVVTGGILEENIEKEITRLFIDLQNPEKERALKKYDGPKMATPRIFSQGFPEALKTTVKIKYLRPKKTYNTREAYSYRAKSTLLTFLYAIRYKILNNSPTANYILVSAERSKCIGNVDEFTNIAYSSNDRVVEALTGLVNENNRIVKYGFTEEELEKAKELANKMLDQIMNSRFTGSNSYWGEIVFDHFIEDNAVIDLSLETEMYQKLYSRVTLKEMNQHAIENISGSPNIVMATGLEAGVATPRLPKNDELSKVLNRALAQDVSPYKKPESIFSSIGKLSPKPIVNREQFDSLNTTVLTLSNGIRVAYMKTDLDDTDISFKGVKKGGYSQFKDSDFPEANYSRSIGLSLGYASLDGRQWMTELRKRGINFHTEIHENSEWISSSVKEDKLRDLFRLLFLRFQAGTYYKTDAGLVRDFLRNSLDDESKIIADIKLDSILYGTNRNRRSIQSISTIDNIDLKKVTDLYQERYKASSDWQFNFAGNFNPDSIEYYSQVYLGNLSTSQKTKKLKSPKQIETYSVKKVRIPVNGDSVSILKLYWSGSFEGSIRDKQIFELLIRCLKNEMYQNNIFEYKYNEIIKGYYPSISNEYSLEMQASSQTDKVDSLVLVFEDLIETYQTAGPSIEMVEQSKEGLTEAIKRWSYSANRHLASLLEEGYLYHLNPDDLTASATIQRIESISADDIKNAASIYFSKNATTRIQLIIDPE